MPTTLRRYRIDKLTADQRHALVEKWNNGEAWIAETPGPNPDKYDSWDALMDLMAPCVLVLIPRYDESGIPRVPDVAMAPCPHGGTGVDAHGTPIPEPHDRHDRLFAAIRILLPGTMRIAVEGPFPKW